MHSHDDYKQQQAKRNHVRHAEQTRDHVCHWPGCGKQVKPAMWGCGPHWFKLPRPIRERIWATYVAGQENTLHVSREYIEAAKAAQTWIEGYVRISKTRTGLAAQKP